MRRIVSICIMLALLAPVPALAESRLPQSQERRVMLFTAGAVVAAVVVVAVYGVRSWRERRQGRGDTQQGWQGHNTNTGR